MVVALLFCLWVLFSLENEYRRGLTRNREDKMAAKTSDKRIEPDSVTPLVFVYGTLKKGHSNNGLLKDAEFIERIKLNGDYYMLDMGAFPGVVQKWDIPAPRQVHPTVLPSSHIFGEVWRITPDILASLDILEGHPNFYFRQHFLIRDRFPQEAVYIYTLPISWVSDTSTANKIPRGADKMLIKDGMWRPNVEEKMWQKEYFYSEYTEK
jgi:gamma-glutamylcyclotransferase (GGCT)/AIG2-like uncharacterized protein YtfP